MWAWFTGGNVLSRIGVIVLFFGVAFLLRELAKFVTVPIEWRLVAVALVGIALIVLGLRLARARPGYGLSLEGAGAGILYLTTFAAFRFYDVLPAIPALALLVAVAGLTVWLALRADSQPLAALAIAGGFLAPFLVSASPESPALLFGYFAVLNGAIFALAWVRAWRALNVLGFVFTFVLGVFWGHRFYRPAYFATVEPFLILFFVFYVTIAVLYAKRGPLRQKAPVDALLVFGVPLVGFALQTALVHDTRYGAAWSALAVAVFYAALAAILLRRTETGPGLARARVRRARHHLRDRRHSLCRRPALDVGLVGARGRRGLLDRLPATTGLRPGVFAAAAGRRRRRVRLQWLRAGRASVSQRHVPRQPP